MVEVAQQLGKQTVQASRGREAALTVVGWCGLRRDPTGSEQFSWPERQLELALLVVLDCHRMF